MTAAGRVRSTRRALLLVVGSSAILWAGAVLFALLVVGAVVSAFAAVPRVVRTAIPVTAALVSVGTLVMLVWRGRFAWSTDRVALWIEERAPELRYALVTAIDPRYAGATAELMEPVVSGVDTGRFVRTATRNSVLPALVALVVAVSVFVAIPASWKTRIGGHGIFGIGSGAPAVVGNRLTPITVRVTPPAYTGLGAETQREPTTVTALIGSRVIITGRGGPKGMVATLEEVPSFGDQNVVLGDSANDDSHEYDAAQQEARRNQGSGASGTDADGESPGLSAQLQQYGMATPATPPTSRLTPRPARAGVKANASTGTARGRAPAIVKAPIVRRQAVTGDGDEWSIAFVVTDSNPALLKLVDRQYHRTIIIDPRADETPSGRLLLPARDTTLRIIGGSLSLSAEFNDDIGLDSARFEYILCSSGAGDEDFKCKGGTYATRRFANVKSGAFTYRVAFADLGMHEGDQLSVRAVVWDRNNVTGPGKGVTETRTIRIARKGEYEKINVTPAPPSADTALITLRMLIIAVENLDKAKPVLQHRIYQDSSVKLSGLGHKVQLTIDMIINVQSGGGEIPVNPLLALARDSMWSAVTDLQVAETHKSLPPLYAAYNALKEYSNTARYYLRGIIEVPVVNIERVRLLGKDSGATTPRTPRLLTGAERYRYRNELVTAMAQSRTSPGNAIEALVLLQVETMRKYPDVSRAVGDAAAALRAKRDPGTALGRARGLIEGKSAAMDTLPLWSGAW